MDLFQVVFFNQKPIQQIPFGFYRYIKKKALVFPGLFGYKMLLGLITVEELESFRNQDYFSSPVLSPSFSC